MPNTHIRTKMQAHVLRGRSGSGWCKQQTPESRQGLARLTRKDEAEPGFMGLTVVPARLKDTTPEIHMAAPMRAGPTEERRYAGNIKSTGGSFNQRLSRNTK